MSSPGYNDVDRSGGVMDGAISFGPSLLEAEVAALDSLLRARIECDNEPLNPDRQYRLLETFKASLVVVETREQSMLRRMVDDPVREAVNLAIRVIGERIFRITKSIDSMLDVAERACELDSDHFGIRMTILDHKWDGIGDDTHGMWAA